MINNKYTVKDILLQENELHAITSLILGINYDMDPYEFLVSIIYNLKKYSYFEEINFVYKKDHRLIIISDSINSISLNDNECIWDDSSWDNQPNLQGTDIFYIMTALREKKEIYLSNSSVYEYKPDHDQSNKMKIRGLYYIPIFVDNYYPIVLRYHNYKQPMRLSERDRRFIRIKISIIIKCLEHLMIIRKSKRKSETIAVDLEMSTKIQRNMLPQFLPDLPGIKIATVYLPMYKVGGDYFDFIIPDSKYIKKFGVFITDATGHGVPAAFITSMLKISFQNKQVYAHASSPAKVLQAVNRMIINKIADNFVTGCYVWFDQEEKKAIISNAGHEPIIRQNRRSGEISRLRPRGRPIGLFDDIELDEIEIPLEPGDRFILYTDGLIESINSNGVPFEVILDSIIDKNCMLSAQPFLDLLIDTCKNHVFSAEKKSFDDDIAVIIIDIVQGEEMEIQIDKKAMRNIDIVHSNENLIAENSMKAVDMLLRKKVYFHSFIFMTSQETIKKGILLMRRLNISQIPIIDGNSVVGSIDESLLLKIMTHGDIVNINNAIASVMGEPMPVLDEHTDIQKVKELMIGGANAIVITRKNLPIGVLSKADFIDMLLYNDDNDIIIDFEI